MGIIPHIAVPAAMFTAAVRAQSIAKTIPVVPLGAQDAFGLLRFHLEVRKQNRWGLEAKHGGRHVFNIRFFFSLSSGSK
jgi:hypothetical protein